MEKKNIIPTINMILQHGVKGYIEPLLENISVEMNIKHVEIIASFPIDLKKNISHVVHDLNKLHYADYEEKEEMIPLDKEIIEGMSKYENMVMRSLAKLEKTSLYFKHLTDLNNKKKLTHIITNHEISYLERKQIYLKHLRYWNDIIIRKKINLFICTYIPHVSIDYILYGLCQYYKIPFISFFDIGPIGRILLIRKLGAGFDHIYESFKSLKEGECGRGKVKLASPIERFVNFQSTKDAEPVPFYMKEPGFGFTFHYYGNNIRYSRYLKELILSTMRKNTRLIISKFLIELTYGYKSRVLKKYYNSTAVEPDLSQKYIYVALHMQPELSTAPLAGPFVDQENIVHLLSSLIPEDTMIYVKEHPAQPGFERTIYFYESMKKLSNVKLIKSDWNTFNLIDNCLATVTCTGTIGWEAMFRDKPVLVFGEFPYEIIPGVFRIETIQDCKTAIHKILNEKIHPHIDDIRLAMKAIEINSLPAFISAPLNEEKKQRLELNERIVIQSLSRLIIKEYNEKIIHDLEMINYKDR